MTAYPRLFSEWTIRNTKIKNRIVFPPTCPTWVSDPWNGLFTDQATAYYAERAKGGLGLIVIGGTHVHPSSITAPALMPQLFDDRQIEPLSKIAAAAHEHGCKLAIQLWHSGVRGFPTFKQHPGYDPDATWYTPPRARRRSASSLAPRRRKKCPRKRSKRSSRPTRPPLSA